MSNFDITHTHRDPDEWKELALQQVGNNNLQAHVFGGFAVSVMVGVTATPMAGAVVALYTLWSAFGKGRAQRENFRVIRKSNCIAHVLEEGDFRAYSRQVGQEAVLRELQFAEEEGLPLSNSAYDYLDTLQEQGALPPANSVPMSGSFAQVATVSDSAQIPDNQIDILKFMVDPIPNLAIFGLGGSGKGMMVANALRKIRTERPNCQIFYIDPKDFEDEHGYTDGIVHVIKRKKCQNRPSNEIMKWVNDCLDEYLEWAVGKEEILLVIDEGTVLGDAADKEKDARIGTHILHVSSLAGAKKEKVWLLAQSPYVKPMGLNLTSASQLTNVCIVTEKNTGMLKAWKRSSLIAFPTEDALKELFRTCKIPKTKRAIFWGGNDTWYSMPALENHSALDRDNDKPVGDALSSEQRGALRDRLQSEQSQATATAIDPATKLVNKAIKCRRPTLDEFIRESLKAEPTDDIRLVVVKALRDRTDLLEKFSLGYIAIPDPIEALKFGNFQDKSDEEIKTAWLLHTGQQLNDLGVNHLREKLGK